MFNNSNKERKDNNPSTINILNKSKKTAFFMRLTAVSLTYAIIATSLPIPVMAYEDIEDTAIVENYVDDSIDSSDITGDSEDIFVNSKDVKSNTKEIITDHEKTESIIGLGDYPETEENNEDFENTNDSSYETDNIEEENVEISGVEDETNEKEEILGNYSDDDCDYISSTGKLTIKTEKGLTQFAEGAFPDTTKLILSIRTKNNAQGTSYTEKFVTLPDSFAKNRDKLTEVEVNKGFQKLGVASFMGCTSLTTIKIQGNTNLSAGIPDDCFNGCVKLTDFGINLDSPKKIGKRAFYNTGITRISLGSAESIGEEAFANCSSMTRATLNKVTSIEPNIFTGCDLLAELEMNSLEEIPKNYFTGLSIERVSFKAVRIIGDNAFKDCSRMTDIYLPESVTLAGSIGKNAFENCTSLVEVDLSVYETIDTEAFMNCIRLKKVTLGATKIINDKVFYDCTSLQKVESSDDLEIIGVSAFENCIKLNSISTGNVHTFGERCFFNCALLASINLNSAITLDNKAFAHCVSLVSINTNYAQNIGEYVFQDCTGLTTVTLSGISQNSIGVFNACNNITTATLTISENSPYIPDRLFDGVLNASDRIDGTNKDDKREMKLVTLYVNATDIERIGVRAFANCTTLLKIPEVFSTCYSIGSLAFNKCESLPLYEIIKTEKNDGEKVVIEASAFEGCNKMTTFNCYAAASDLAEASFYGCEGLKNFYMNGFDLNIGERAFQNSFSKTKKSTAIFSGTINVISDYAFSDAKMLQTVVLSSSECLGGITFGPYAFANCENLEKLTVYNNIIQYTPEEYIALLEEKNNPETPSENAVSPEDGIKDTETNEIELIKGLFLYEKELDNKNILIGEEYGRTNMLDEGTFSIYHDYTNPNLYNSKRHSYPRNTLNNVDFALNLGTVDDLQIPFACFEGGNIHKLKYKGRITLIAANAFYFCHRLEKFDDDGDDDDEIQIGENAFANCMNLKKMKISSTIIPGTPGTLEYDGKDDDGEPKYKEKITKDSFGPYAFASCENLEELEIIISDDVTVLPDGMVCAFYQEQYKTNSSGDPAKEDGSYVMTGTNAISKLKTVEINDKKGCEVEKIGDNAFSGNYVLEGSFDDITKKVWKVGKGAFSGCTAIKSMRFPVEKNECFFEDSSFMNCSGLTSFSVKSPVCIGKNAFANVSNSSNKTTYDIPVITAIGEKAFYNSFSAPGTFTVTGSSKYSDTADVIGTYAFYNVPTHMEVTFEGALKKADDSCFENCVNLTKANVEIFKEIGKRAFAHTGLTEATINAAYVSEGAMADCIDLKKLTIADSVQQVAELAFSGDVFLKEIYIGTGIQDLSAFALSTLTSLEKMTIMGHPSGTIIPDNLMRNNTSLTTLILGDNVSGIGSYAFYKCPIYSLTIPKNCKEIGDYAFALNPELTEINLHEGDNTLIRIGKNAFSECTSLEKISIPAHDGLDIDDKAFLGCVKLKEVTFEEGLKRIGEMAFAGCAIEKVDLPLSLKVLDKDAFMSNLSMTEIRFKNKVTQVYNSSSTIPATAIIYTEVDTTDFDNIYLTPYVYALRYIRDTQKKTEEFGNYTPPEDETVTEKIKFERKIVRIPTGGCEVVLHLTNGAVTDVDTGWTFDKKTVTNGYIDMSSVQKGPTWIKFRTTGLSVGNLNDDEINGIKGVAKVTASAKIVNAKGKEVRTSATSKIIIENPGFKRGATTKSGTQLINNKKQPYTIKEKRTKAIKVAGTALNGHSIKYEIVDNKDYVELPTVQKTGDSPMVWSVTGKNIKIKGKKTTHLPDGSENYVKVKATLTYERGKDENGDLMAPFLVERYALVKVKELNKL